MPLSIQGADVAGRLQKFFRLTGRVTTALDPVVVPVVEIGDLYLPPWRLPHVASDFTVSGSKAAGGAGEKSYIAIKQPPDVSGRTVIRQVDFWNQNAAARVLAINYSEGGWITGQTSVENLVNTENPAPNPTGGAGVLPERLGPTMHLGDNPISAGVQIAALGALAGETKTWPCRLTLPPGWQIILMLTTANEPLDVTIQGTYYPAA